MEKTLKPLQRIISGILLLSLLAGCSVSAVTPPPIQPTAGATPLSISPTTTFAPSPMASARSLTLTPTPTFAPTSESRADGLSSNEAATLNSLEQVDDYPLYTMRYYGTYTQTISWADGVNEWTGASLPNASLTVSPPAWACSLFAALGDAKNMLYGRNFDWVRSPAVLLFTDPPDGYASVSMVDIEYLGFAGAQANNLTARPLAERRALLRAPTIPFDGMNERGLVVGMAAVPSGQMRPDPAKKTLGSLGVIRRILDRASNVNESVAIFQSYNVSMEGGPPIHYLIADAAGHSVLVEFYQGKLVVIPNETPWHLATNFLRASVGESAKGQCWRYDKLNQRLTETQGQMTMRNAIDLLAQVSQDTQWSIVYGMTSGDVNVAMRRRYDNVHTFYLPIAGKE